MRSGVLVVAVAALGGCSDPGGVKFEIDASADPRASEVRLYVGTGGGASAAITADGQKREPLRTGTFWPLDDADSVDVVQLTGANLSYLFTPVDGVDEVTVIAVGFTGGAPTSKAALFKVPVRTDVIAIWDLVLVPAVAVAPNGSTDVVDGVQVWGATSEAQTCVQAVGPQAPYPIAFIGMEGDKDCDGYSAGTPAECDDEWHKGGTTLTTSSLSCLESVDLTTASSGVIDVCMFGGEYCVDGEPAGRGACSHAKPYCAPSELCTLCSHAGDAKERFECALGLVPSTPPQAGDVTPTTCSLLFDISSGMPVLCTQRFALGRPRGADNLTCTPSAPTYHSAATGSGWSSTRSVGGVKLAFVPGPPGDCSLEIAVARDPNAPFDAGVFAQEHGLVAADFANGRGAVGALDFSVEMTTGGCDMAGSTQPCITPPLLSATDTVARCLALAPTVEPSP